MMQPTSIISPVALILLIGTVVLGGAGYYFVRSTGSPETTITPGDIPHWKTYTSSEQHFIFKYPAEYVLSIEPANDSELLSLLLEYPSSQLGLTRGVTMRVFNDTVANTIPDLTAIPGITQESDVMFAATTWKSLRYDPQNDPAATDQDKTISYYTEKNGNVYSIQANLSATDTITESQIVANLDRLRSSFTFTR